MALWQFLHDPVALTRVLGWVALGMFLSLVLLFVLVVLQRIAVDQESRAEERIHEGFARALSQGMAISALQVDPRERLHRRAIARAVAGHPRPQGEQELLAAPWFPRLLRHLQRDARHRHWGRRAAAYEALGQLSAHSLRHELVAAAQREPHPHANGTCLQAAARLCDGPAEALEIARLVGQRHVLSGSFNEGIFRSLIDAIVRHAPGEDAATQLRGLFAQLEARPALLHDALLAAGKSGLAAIAPALAERYGQPGATLDVRIACTRALGGLAPSHPALVAALRDPDWQVQVSAARLVDDGQPATVATLRELLCSPHFHVRRNAALALRRLGERGDAALRAALDGPDAFARAVSRFALGTPVVRHA